MPHLTGVDMSVFIQIDAKLAITSDSYSWQASELRKDKKSGGERFAPRRYYPTLELLLNKEAERAGMLSKADSATELLLERENALCELARVLAPYSYTVHVTGPRPDTGNPVNSEQVTRIPVGKGPIQ